MSNETHAASVNGIDQTTMEGWLVDAYASIEDDLEVRDPEQRPMRTIIDRHGHLLQILGAVQLGLLVASGCMFACFILLNLIFHMQP
jgi:hypothetical protein